MIELLMRRRDAIKKASNLPYDARLDYLESSGSQHIDTGISNETVNSLIFEICCQFNATTSGYNGSGYTTTNSQQAFYALNSNNNTGLYACFAHNTSNIPKKMSDAKTDWHTFRVEISNGVANYYLDDVLKASYSTNAFTIEKFFLFRLATNGNTQGVQGSKISKAYLSINGVDKFDMIPVRKVQVGYMYDRVSGELFGNAGGGSFILGNDIN